MRASREGPRDATRRRRLLLLGRTIPGTGPSATTRHCALPSGAASSRCGSSIECPLPLLVFFARIAVPVLKLVGLSIMLITIESGVGALAFCAVVILTMFAAETFDPRLMWEISAQRNFFEGDRFRWAIDAPVACAIGAGISAGIE
jgi:hypothetical protein